MGRNVVQQVEVDTASTARKQGTFVQRTAFFDANGVRVAPRAQAANVAQNATANGSDLATTQALANSLKVTVNGILTSLKGAKVMVPD